MNYSNELRFVSNELFGLRAIGESPEFLERFGNAETAIDLVGKSSNGSWYGYHSRVYYRDFQTRLPAEPLVKNGGLMQGAMGRRAASEGWSERPAQEVEDHIYAAAKIPDLLLYEKIAGEAIAAFDDARAKIVSTLSRLNRQDRGDEYLADLLKEAKETTTLTASELIERWTPKGQTVSRDTDALLAGLMVPPHVMVAARINAIRQPLFACGILGKLAKRAADHLDGLDSSESIPALGCRIFLGHGHSTAWKTLKDFLQDRLNLEWDEFDLGLLT